MPATSRFLNSRRSLWLIAALAIILRVAVAVFMGDTTPPMKDETSYSMLAARLATGDGYSFPISWYPFTPPDTPTSHWSFLYTAFVAGVYFVFGPHPLAARVLQGVLVGLLLPWLTYRLSRRIFGGERVPLLAALLSAVYAYFVLYGAMVQTEGFFICAVLWTLERGLRLEGILSGGLGRRAGAPEVEGLPSFRAALTFGISLGVATLLRQSILPWVAVMLLYLLAVRWRTHRADGRAPLSRFWRALAPLFVAGIVLLACIAPFTVRNYRVYGEFLLLNSNAGYAMYSAQHPLHGTSFQQYAAASLPADLTDKGLNEAQWDKALMARGVGFVLADPGRYLLLSLSRVADYFEFWPTADSSVLFNLGRLLSFTLFLPFMLAGIVLAARRYGSRPALIYLFMVVYSVLHIFTWAMSRYRLPVDAVALPFAAVALLALYDRIRQARSARRSVTVGSAPR